MNHANIHIHQLVVAVRLEDLLLLGRLGRVVDLPEQLQVLMRARKSRRQLPGLLFHGGRAGSRGRGGVSGLTYTHVCFWYF